MKSGPKQAIELIRGDREASHGTSFCIGIAGDEAFYVTCAHVIQEVLKTSPKRAELKGEKVQVGGAQGQVVFTGGDDCDLVVLSVPLKDVAAKAPLVLVELVEDKQQFKAYGYQFSGRTPRVKEVGGRITLRTWEGIKHRIDCSELLADRGEFKKGMSGGPVLNKQGYVLGMLTQRDGEKTGSALDICQALQKFGQDAHIAIAPSQQDRFLGKGSGHLVPPMLPYTADRRNPKREFAAAIAQKRQGLVVVLTRGATSAEHAKFFEVISYQFLGIEEGNLFKMIWQPNELLFNMELEQKVTGQQSLSLKGDPQDLKSIFRAMPPGDVCIALRGQVTSEDQRHAKALVSWLLNWQELEIKPEKTVVLGVSFGLHEEGDRLHQKVWARVRNGLIWKRLKAALKKIPHHDLGILGSVRRDDLEEWQEDTEHWLKNAFTNYQHNLSHELNALFKNRQLMSMRDLGGELRQLLQRLCQGLNSKHH